MEFVICGDKSEDWTMEYLQEHVIASHGYGKGSDSFLFFLNIILEMTPEETREFLMFTIGAPRLPLGGLANLSPKLTVVKKIPAEYQNADHLLPSVMT